jgi:diguanylate cyclase (GGDEF)-like protein
MSSQVYSNRSGFVRRIQAFSLDGVPEMGKKMVKRCFDFTMALIGLIVLTPVFVYVSILIKRDSPGPIFFWGTRMGKNGKPFRILKFRTMYETPESYQGPRVTADKDNRITPLGHWLRDTKINELPQLWNVLIGEMSLVGPRPEDVEITKTWPKDAFEEILSISPGITSPTSVLYHDEEKMLSNDNLMGDYLRRILPDKIRLDRLYVRNHRFFSDLDAIFWTIAIIIPQLSKAKIPEGYIFAGPISRLIHRYVSWFIIDFLVAFVVAYMGSLLWVIGGPAYFGSEYLMAIALILALLFSGFNALIGLDRVLWSEATLDDAIRLTISSLFVTAMILTANYLQSIRHFLSLPSLPTRMIVFICAVAGFGFLSTRYRFRLLSAIARRWVDWRQGTSNVGERVLIVGSGEGSRIATYLLKQHIFRTAFSIVGVVDNNNPSQHGMRVRGNWILGGIRDIPTLIERFDIGMILSTIPLHDLENEHLLEICQIPRTRLIFLDDLLSMTDRQMTRPQGQVDSQLWTSGYLEYKAMHDVVTGLPNRYLLQDRIQYSLARAKRYGIQPMLVFVEMSEVKKINEIFGEKISNKLLKNVAERLGGCKRESDTLARFGFDKFAFLLENVPSEREVAIITERIGGALAKPIQVDGHEFLLDARIDRSLCQGTCSAGGRPESVEIAQCYDCVMSRIVENKKEVVNS